MTKETMPTLPREEITVCFLNPAILPEWFWLPVAHQIEEKGLKYVIPELDRENPDVSIKDNVDIIEAALEQHDHQYVVALSRGVEYAVRYIDRMNKHSRLQKVLGWTVMSSVGPRGYEAVTNAENIPMSRHTRRYSRGIILDDDGLERIDPTVAADTLLHDLTDPDLLRQTLKDMIPNRALADSEISSVPRLKKNLLPLAWYIGARDEVDNVELSAQVASQKFGVVPKFADWGHVAPLTNPAEVADIIALEADRAVKIRSRHK